MVLQFGCHLVRGAQLAVLPSESPIMCRLKTIFLVFFILCNILYYAVIIGTVMKK